jgi:hypothetical protein
MAIFPSITKKARKRQRYGFIQVQSQRDVYHSMERRFLDVAIQNTATRKVSNPG